MSDLKSEYQKYRVVINIGQRVNLLALTQHDADAEMTDSLTDVQVTNADRMPSINERTVSYKLSNGAVFTVSTETGNVSWEDPAEGTSEVLFNRIDRNRRGL